MTITELVNEAHRNSVEHDFWPDGHGIADMPEDIDLLLSKLMLIVTEVAEAAEALREWGHMREVSQSPELHDREHLGEELADIIIRVGDFAGALGLDLESAIASKMARNRERPRMHGKLA